MKKVLTRSGFRASFSSPRILIYHLVSIDEALHSTYDQTNKLINKAMQLNQYYVISTTKDNEKKYIHIEKDNTISLEDKPTCFFEKDVFDNEYYFREYEEFIFKEYKKTNFYKTNPNMSFELVSNFDMRRSM